MNVILNGQTVVTVWQDIDTEALSDSKSKIIATADICPSDSQQLFVFKMAFPKQNHQPQTIWDA